MISELADWRIADWIDVENYRFQITNWQIVLRKEIGFLLLSVPSEVKIF